uniref:Putative uncharacterized protein n=1 Tax=Crocosphaera subtropica (strain ATCC 51142 / BH68) TaxID=43989 RepID=UPI0001761607|nr:Chain A, Structural characterization of a protein in the DUF683 family- crystal structure of cce_0567 from the cyanobacterium Cyanothece 51142. [Cyanothece]3CSX_B Chain B, Structural characterization of a protein in the DUF683 family- crystal structure of cce_0567 from the cyanobacterium Cyanothece 51142. [Cyanothece]
GSHMTVATDNNPTPEAVADLKKKVRKLNSKAGQMKMDLHDLAEGLPTDYENLVETAEKTYEIFRELDQLKKKLNIWEETLK